jgi:hypothetical protein
MIESVSRLVLVAGFVFALGCQRAGPAPIAVERAPVKATASAASSSAATASASAAPAESSAPVAAEPQVGPIATMQQSVPVASSQWRIGGVIEPDTVRFIEGQLGGAAVDLSPVDHGPGQPILGVCDLKLVNWKQNPIVFGIERFVQVADAKQAKALQVRSYAIQPARFIDANKDGAPDLAIVRVLQFAPDAANGMKQWGEVHFFVARHCKVGSVLVVKTGPKP